MNNSIFDDFFGTSLYSTKSLSCNVVTKDIHSKLDGNKFIICLDMPGVDPETLEVSFFENVFTISGTKNTKFSNSSIKKEFYVPYYINVASIEATYENGCLVLSMDLHHNRSKVEIKVNKASGK